MGRADFVLGFVDGFEGARRDKSENRGSEADHALIGNEHGTTENIGIDLIQDIVLLGNASRVNYTLYVHTVPGHPVKDDASVKRGPFDGGKEFVLRGALQVPPQRNAAQVRVDQNGAVAVIPSHAEQARLSGTIVLEACT